MQNYGQFHSKFVISVLLLCSILPVLNIAGYGFPVLYLFIPICLFIFQFYLFGWIPAPKILQPITILFVLIIVEVLLSTVVGTITELNSFIFPKDLIQYVARYFCILFFILIFYNSDISVDFFVKLFLAIMSMAMFVGLAQWFSWPGQKLFLSLYKFRDGSEQLAQLGRELYQLRVHGVAQFATANSGVAAFAFLYATAIYIFYKRYKPFCFILMVLSLLNIVASQGRAGILMLIAGIVIFYFMRIYTTNRSIKPTLWFILVFAAVTYILWGLYEKGNPFISQIMYRWNALIESGGGARIEQIKFSLSLLSDPYHYIFGISRAFQSYGNLSFHIEVEPINIFVLYGVLGFAFQYSLIVLLLFYFIKNLKCFKKQPEIMALIVASFIGLLSYQVFSLGYFFFREIRIGLIPWILMGTTIGIVERYKKNQLVDKR